LFEIDGEDEIDLLRENESDKLLDGVMESDGEYEKDGE